MKPILDIWNSFRALPIWVQIWVILILVPINMGGLFFLDTPQGRIAALLGIGGMLPNLIIVWMQRGFSNAMAFPHLPMWTPLVIWLAWTLSTAQPTGALGIYLMVLLLIDIVSLAFDYSDAWKWWQGDRAVTRPTTTD